MLNERCDGFWSLSNDPLAESSSGLSKAVCDTEELGDAAGEDAEFVAEASERARAAWNDSMSVSSSPSISISAVNALLSMGRGLEALFLPDLVLLSGTVGGEGKGRVGESRLVFKKVLPEALPDFEIVSDSDAGEVMLDEVSEAASAA